MLQEVSYNQRNFLWFCQHFHLPTTGFQAMKWFFFRISVAFILRPAERSSEQTLVSDNVWIEKCGLSYILIIVVVHLASKYWGLPANACITAAQRYSFFEPTSRTPWYAQYILELSDVCSPCALYNYRNSPCGWEKCGSANMITSVGQQANDRTLLSSTLLTGPNQQLVQKNLWYPQNQLRKFNTPPVQWTLLLLEIIKQ